MPDKGPIAGTDDDQRYTVTGRECLAIQLLYQDGWSTDLLSMVFEIHKSSVWPHINQTCDHRYDHVDLPGVSDR